VNLLSLINAYAHEDIKKVKIQVEGKYPSR